METVPIQNTETERKMLFAKIKKLEAENKSQVEHIELLNQCDDSSTDVIYKMDKEIEEKDKRIVELGDLLGELYDEAAYEKAGEWVLENKELQEKVKQALKSKK